MSVRAAGGALAGALIVFLGAFAAVMGRGSASEGRLGAHDWSWREANVDPRADNVELLYGSEDVDPRRWVLAARVGRPSGRDFPVEWLVDREAPDNREMIEAVRRDLDFYLKDVGRPDPWAYAQYHCETTSNLYGYVHWAWIPAQLEDAR